jgi:aerobic C4-dicarboxylate transport protein
MDRSRLTQLGDCRGPAEWGVGTERARDAAVSDATGAAALGRKHLYKLLYVQVLAAIALGFLLGWLAPGIAQTDWVNALGDGFVKLIKMVIAPIIFCTVASGIAHIEDARKVGRVGLKALVYFEIVSTLALALGLLIGNVVQPGAGSAASPSS